MGVVPCVIDHGLNERRMAFKKMHTPRRITVFSNAQYRGARDENSMCLGPRWGGANCLRHVTELNQSEEIKAKVRKMPDWLLALGMTAIKHGMASDKWYAPHVKALSKRHAAALAQTILRLYKDRPLLEGMSQRARKPRSMEAYAQQIDSLYQEILDRKRKKNHSLP